MHILQQLHVEDLYQARVCKDKAHKRSSMANDALDHTWLAIQPRVCVLQGFLENVQRRKILAPKFRWGIYQTAVTNVNDGNFQDHPMLQMAITCRFPVPIISWLQNAPW